MNGHHSIAIPVGFMLLVLVLCWYLAYAKGDWKLKLTLIVLLSGYGFEVWTALDSYAGWPSAEQLPKRSLLISAVVREPNPSIRDPGAIYVWVRPLQPGQAGLFGYDPGPDEPRAFRLRYSRELHEQMQAGMQAVGQGRPIVLERNGLGGGAGSGSGQGSGQPTDGTDGVHLYELPPATPTKDPQTATPTP